MVAVVGTDRRRGAGTLARVEPARRGPALEAPVESVPSTVVPRTEPQTTPLNAVMEGQRLHVGVPETTSYRKTPRVPVEVTVFAPKAIAARLFEAFPDALQ